MLSLPLLASREKKMTRLLVHGKNISCTTRFIKQIYRAQNLNREAWSISPSSGVQALVSAKVGVT
jgi:hypothetical protein